MSGKENQKKGKKEKKKGSIFEVTLQPSNVSDDSPRETDPVSSQKTLSPANNQPTLLPNSSEHESDYQLKLVSYFFNATQVHTLIMLKLPLFSVLDVDYSTNEVVNASKPTPSTLSSKIGKYSKLFSKV